VTAGVFLGSALLIHVLNRVQSSRTVLDTAVQAAPSVELPPPTSAPAAPPGGNSEGN
jgi:hypothetical protein